MQHDVDYAVCGDNKKCKHRAGDKLVQALDAVPKNQRQWGHRLARNAIKSKRKLECLHWCHIRHLNPLKRNPQRITLKDKELVKTLDYSGVTFPVTIKLDIKKIEKQNKVNIKVFGYSDQNPYPIQISSEKYEDHLELLLIEEEKSQPKKHFVLIKDFNQFMYNFPNHKTKKYFCLHCLQCFYFAEHLENHKEECLLLNGTQKVEMPLPGTKVYFKNHQRQLC